MMCEVFDSMYKVYEGRTKIIELFCTNMIVEYSSNRVLLLSLIPHRLLTI
jgi:hypothetical protein